LTNLEGSHILTTVYLGLDVMCGDGAEMVILPPFPTLQNVGLSGVLVTFSNQLTEPANRAALAFRACVDAG
jgi:hypothetical protein